MVLDLNGTYHPALYNASARADTRVRVPIVTSVSISRQCRCVAFVSTKSCESYPSVSPALRRRRAVAVVGYVPFASVTRRDKPTTLLN